MPDVERCVYCNEIFEDIWTRNPVEGGNACNMCFTARFYDCDECHESTRSTTLALLRDDRRVCPSCVTALGFSLCNTCNRYVSQDAMGDVECRVCAGEYFSCICCATELPMERGCPTAPRGGMICPVCRVGQRFFECVECGNTWHRSNMWHRDQGSWPEEPTSCCVECWERLHPRCNGCGIPECELNEWGVCEECQGNGIGLVHEYDYHPDPVFWPEKPKEDKLYLGVEVETDGEKSYIADNIRAVYGGEGRVETHVYQKNDGTVSGPEIVSHPATLEFHKSGGMKWDEVMKTLRVRAQRPSVETGLHVHVGTQNGRPNVRPSVVSAFLIDNREMIEKLSGRAAFSYCSYENISEGEKYGALGLSNYNTIEYRIFRSTRNIRRLWYRIEFAHALTSYLIGVRAVCTDWALFATYVKENECKYPELLQWMRDEEGEDTCV